MVDEEKTQMYASVEVKGDELHFVTKTVGGRVVDEFTLTKPNPEQIVIKSDELTLAAGESHELQAR